MELLPIFVFLLVAVIFFAWLFKGKEDRVSPPKPVARPNHPNLKPFQSKTAKPVAQTINGPAYVVDGDTIKIKQTQIRLFGIDAPEMNHPYGKKAKLAMVALCKGQIVRAEITEKDAHGRTVAQCFLPDGRDLSAELVKQGLAIDWPKFSGGVYRDMETPDARKKMWLADARQKGRMHVWEKFEAGQK
ncbi:Endonuclease YncB, thermonuclease family [Cognatiyoonia koreensis]|uniref:Endonuclease YncB, thermonuclease family n=1 Tax=Cognatiyoonia koreensis TaxID=364200 RepID=A0A1I0PZ73_9RHOB|nr:thermonuclease family protein [Cognatiyoonia koreensis]SEW19910.1 Endonuclease YncB, thermonuclease family [Cognatiyoonia koreensis]